MNPTIFDPNLPSPNILPLLSLFSPLSHLLSGSFVRVQHHCHRSISQLYSLSLDPIHPYIHTFFEDLDFFLVSEIRTSLLHENHESGAILEILLNRIIAAATLSESSRATSSHDEHLERSHLGSFA